MKSFFILLLSLLVSTAFGQNQEVEWEFKVKKAEPHIYVIQATAHIKEGWYVYSQYLESDKGPIATYWTFEENYPVELVGDPVEEGPKVEGWDELFDMNITKYKKQLVLEHIIKIEKGQRQAKGHITFMSCNDKQCMPPSQVEFDLKLPK